MRRALLLIAFVLVVAIVWFLWPQDMGQNSNANFGTYSYVCDNGTELQLGISEDASTIAVQPGKDAKFPETKITRMTEVSYARYEGGGMSLFGAGEEITIAYGEGPTFKCNPKPNPDMAPFNFGDPVK